MPNVQDKNLLGKYFKGNLIQRVPKLLHNYRGLSNDDRIEMVLKKVRQVLTVTLYLGGEGGGGGANG
jgi:hypothetical protein